MKTFLVRFDGGNHCNNPSNYGIGYGSVQIDGGPIVRLDHKLPMSNNAAEVATALEAARFIQSTCNPKETGLQFETDSMIAVKWILASRVAKKPKMSKNAS